MTHGDDGKMIKKRHIFCVAFCLAAVLLLGACTGSAEDAAPPEAGVPSSVPVASKEPGVSSPVPEPSKEPDASSPAPDLQPNPEAVPDESEPEEPMPSPEGSETPETLSPEPSREEGASGPVTATSRLPSSDAVVPAQAEPVGDEYFDDAAFIGNSLVVGFHMYSGLSNCDYYAKTSMTVLGIGDYITQMSSIEYGKVYMLLGINELTYSLDKLMEAYGRAVDRISKDHPGVLIYIMGVSPVSAAKNASSKTFTMANVRRFNERLLQFVEEKNCYYIDLCDAMGGDDGFLPADVTTDGIHFKPSGYKVWLDYLRYHYIPVAEPTEDPAEEPTEEPEPGPAEDPAEEPTDEPEGGPAEDPVAEPTEEPEPEPAGDPAAE